MEDLLRELIDVIKGQGGGSFVGAPAITMVPQVRNDRTNELEALPMRASVQGIPVALVQPQHAVSGCGISLGENQSLIMELAESPSTQPDVVVSYLHTRVDGHSKTYTKTCTLTDGTETTICAAPKSGESKTVLHVSVLNRDASAITVTPKVNDNGSKREQKDWELANNQVLWFSQGKWSGPMETADLADDAVTTAKIADDAVTNAKIAGGAVDNEHLNKDIISGATVITAISDSDKILLGDASDSDALKAITRANFFGGASKSLLPGGKYLFIQNATPTANAAGDRWWETDTNIMWFWDGTYWLTEQMFTFFEQYSGTAADDARYGSEIGAAGHDVFLMNHTVNVFVAGTNDGSNYWEFRLSRLSSSGAALLSSLNTSALSVNTWCDLSSLGINTHLDVSAFGTGLQFYLQVLKTSSPGNLFGSQKIQYRWAHT